MTRGNVLLLLALVVAAAVAAVYLLRNPGDKAMIKKALSGLSESVSKTSEEGPVTLVTKTGSIERFFDDRCGLEIPGCPLNGDYTPQEISSHAVQARTQFSSIRLRFVDVDVELAGDGKADAHFTAMFDARHKNGGDVSEVREATCSLVKRDGRWLFTCFRAIETVRK